jgi:hypothetical protein
MVLLYCLFTASLLFFKHSILRILFYTFEHLKCRIFKFKDKIIIKYIWVNIILQLFYLILKERPK